MVRFREHLLPDRLLRHDALDESAAVPDLQKVNLSAGPPLVEPAADRHSLTFEPGDVFYVSEHLSPRARVRSVVVRGAPPLVPLPETQCSQSPASRSLRNRSSSSSTSPRPSR